MAMEAESSAELTPPKPRSPPKYPDFSGRRRLHLEVQNLNREVGFLQEELQSLEGLQPVSACCKQVNEFVGTNPDPLMPVIKKKHGSCYVCRWIGSKVCCTFSWIFCCTDCTGCSNKPDCCTCCSSLKNLFCCGCKCGCLRCCCDRKLSCCRLPPCTCRTKEGSCCTLFHCCCSWNLLCCGLPRCCGCKEDSCCKNPCRCFLTTCSCPEYSCGCVFDCPKCSGVKLCPKCSKPCCVTGCLC